MGGWGSGPGMVEESQLEEGEAGGYSKNDDSSIDLDIALSYIGDKVQSILGHLQKDFEGGVSAENLGAKFGGYGSFLPTYQRSPSIWSQPKSPQRVQNPSLSTSPNRLVPEGPACNSLMFPDVPSASPPTICSSRTLKPSLQEASTNQNGLSSSDQISKTCPRKIELPSSKSGGTTTHRPMKVRIKVGSERMEQYNAEIFNLGLTSPSSSAGNSPHEAPEESPDNILQVMTSFPVSGGMLLSPLGEDLLHLFREKNPSVEIESEVARKSSAISVRLLNNGVHGGKKRKSIDKSEKFEKSENGMVDPNNNHKQKKLERETLESRMPSSHDLTNKPLSDKIKDESIDKSEKFEKSENGMVDPNNHKQKKLERETLESRMQSSHHLTNKPLSDKIRDEKDVQGNKRKESKDRVKGRAVSGDLVKDSEHTTAHSSVKYDHPESGSSSVENVGERQNGIYRKDVAVDHGPDIRNRGIRSRSSSDAVDISEGARIKGVTNSPSLKVSLKGTTYGDRHGSGKSCDVDKLSFESEKKSKGSLSSVKITSKLAGSSSDGSYAAPKDKSSGTKRAQKVPLSRKETADTSLVHIEDQKRVLERTCGERPKHSNPEAAKLKLPYGDKLKERSSNRKHFDKLISETYMQQAPAAAIPSNEGVVTGLEQTVAAPVVIQEDWVGCDRCQKWRLLPYGTKAEQLPDKWVCSMLDWLPGMNRCDIIEDVTTSALRASYLVPVPETQSNFQAPAHRTVSGINLTGAPHFDQNHQNFASSQVANHVKKQKLREKLSTVSMSSPVPSSDGKIDTQLRALKNGSTKEVGLSLGGVNSMYKSSLQHPNKSATGVSSSSKRKNEHMIKDDANPRKKSKKESVQRVQGKLEKIKSEGALDAEKLETSGRNVFRIGHNLTPGLSNKAAVKSGKKQSSQKDATSGGMENFKIFLKKQKSQMQNLLDNETIDMETSSGREASAKKRKIKEDDQHLEQTSQVNLGHLQNMKGPMKDEIKDNAFQIDKKSPATQIEAKVRSTVDDVSKPSAEPKVVLSGSKEYPINRGVEKEKQLRKQRLMGTLTTEDIDKLKKDLGFEQPSTAATSSSSKISDSRKNRVSYVDMKGSPVESVSSSPARINELIGNSVFDFREGDARDNGELVSGVNLPSDFVNSPQVGNECNIIGQCSPCPISVPSVNRSHNKERMSKDHSNVLPKHNPRKTSSSRSAGKNKTEHDGNGVNLTATCSADVKQNINMDSLKNSVGKVPSQEGVSCPSKHTSLKRSSTNSRPLEDSKNGDASKAPNDAAVTSHQHRAGNLIDYNKAEQSISLEKNFCGAAASSSLRKAEDILKEAEELRTHADLIKSSGFGSESNYEYFKAALKFLQGASLLEASNGESSKHSELNPMQMYSTAAKICKTCAYEYEKVREIAGAALAYKCMEVAYLRVVYCKSSSTSRVWHDLQSSLQMIPPGESPSSSASDIDNLNNPATAEKATLSKGNGSQAGNHVIVPRNLPNFVRLLDFTKDVNAAMEASRKSHDILAEHEESRSKEAIVSVRSVIDFSFQDVDEFIRLVWVAFNIINHQGLSSGREREY